MDDQTKIEQLEEEIHLLHIKCKKRQKMGPIAIGIIFVWLIFHSVAVVWWAHIDSNRMEALEEKTAARYFAYQAEADFGLRDQRMDFLQKQLDDFKKQHDCLIDEHK